MGRVARRFARCTMAALIMILPAGAAFAQKAKQPGSDITVSKTDPAANFTTIQAAVNAARAGQVIEILDTATYAEQVTVDGREKSPWAGVTGGKNGITIRYAPPAGTAPNSNFVRPTIRYRDTQNTSPKTAAEASRDGELTGSSGNYQTCGALRILYASGVTIEGLIIDGGSAYPFGAASVWCPSAGGTCSDFFHGNAAVAVAVSGNVQIRDCETRNAYFGIYIKDRNVGGVFANPNPSDNDYVVPLSNFGRVGNHLIEYNKIHDNDVGMFIDGAYDLGSTIRYNLIYSNWHKTTTTMPASVSSTDWTAGAILFKDTYLSPVAIYNNTFYDNTMNLIGNWQVGYQHLVFNNIFSKLHAVGSTSTSGYQSFMSIESMFSNRMKHNVFAADGQVQIQNRSDYCDGYKTFVVGVMFSNFTTPARISQTIMSCYPSGSDPRPLSESMVLPGALIPGGRDGGAGALLTFPTGANNRWLETAGYTDSYGSLPVLFKSITPTSPDFLVPNWDSTSVQTYIRNGGWPDGGIVNVDGTVADLGAIQYSGKRPCDGTAQTSRARIFPSSIVTINGTTATAGIYVKQEIGSLSGLSIKYLRWIIPIPNNGSISTYGESSFGNNGIVVPATAIRTITIPAGTTLTTGSNTVNFTVPALGVADSVGFFELVLEGKDGGGKTVSSDVGFLPYRKRGNYVLDIEFFPPTGAMTAATRITEVSAGDPVRMRVTALNGETPFTTGPLSNVNFTLISAAASMYSVSDDAPFTSVSSMAVPTATYEVYFTREGNESVAASGAYVAGTQAVAFLGAAAINVTRTVKLVYSAGANGVVLGATLQNVLPGASGDAVIAVADPGYSFVMWSDGVKTATRTDKDVASDISVTAIFATEGAHVLLYVAGEGGTVSGSVIQEVAPGGSGAPVLAMPNTGYVFVSWSDGLKDVARIDSNITSDVILTAVFARIHRLSYGAGANGSVLGSLEQSVIAGSNGTMVMAVANPGYRFESWSDGVTTESRTDINVSADIAVTAIFGEHKYILSYKASAEHGMILISGGSVQEVTDRVDPGANGPQVMAVGNTGSGYTFHSWSDGETAALRQDLDVQRDIIVQAYFADANGNISVASNERVIPNGRPGETVVVAPVNLLTAEFKAGPNPVNKSSGAVNFFRQGVGVEGGTLVIYDIFGNFVRKVSVSDKAVGSQARRKVGSWDLTDGKGRRVSTGTYLVRGTVTKKDGRKENVSLIVGVR